MKKTVFALMISAGSLVPPALPAVPLSDISDVMIVRDEFGQPIAFRIITEAREKREGPDHLYFIPPQDVGAMTSRFGHPMFMTDDNGAISDVVGVAKVGPPMHPIFELAFMSDLEISHIDIQVAERFFGPQSGWMDAGGELNPIDITRYINTVECFDCTGTFQSDGATGIPDGGSTVSLLGCALLGLAALRRKLSC